MQQSIIDAVYGEEYRSAQQQMTLLEQAIIQQAGKGFKSAVECAHWAQEHLLDIRVFSKSQKMIYYASHRGDVLAEKSWFEYYSKDILYYWLEDTKGKQTKVAWLPSGFEYSNEARVEGEVEIDGRQPLRHRNYFTPTGYYNTSTATFNVAKPFPVHAAQTNADTAHLYTYIDHVAGECAPWLLAWLRAKMIYPCEKTQVTPVIISRVQGNGKTTFAEVLCKGLFGKDNVIVSESYDATARFNADSADKLIICIEEKDENDKRNQVATLKSRATATTVRKEHKGIDPTYQDDFAEYISTTNRDVPLKFEGNERQRRFMVMEADANFTRATSTLADEVFTKLYGKDRNGVPIGIPFVEDTNLIAQFKHELFTRKDIAAVSLRDFPETAAAKRCRDLPRTSEAVDIENILRSLAPFIKAALAESKYISMIPDPHDPEKNVTLSSILNAQGALQYIPAVLGKRSLVALCQPLVFYDLNTSKPYQHAVVERSIYDAEPWLLSEYGIMVERNMSPLPGGFMSVQGRARNAPAARFGLAAEEIVPAVYPVHVARSIAPTVLVDAPPPKRIGERLRVNHHWQPDPEGEYETLNEMKPGVTTLENKTANVQYMDTFLFEGDETTKAIYMIEEQRTPSDAERFFRERLQVQRREAERLYKAGVAARVVYSGGKSYHIIVRVKDSPSNMDERKWLHGHLSTVISTKLTFDPVTYDPARLTRAPITYIRKFEYNGKHLIGTQRLIYENWNNVYDYNWRAQYQTWQNRPLYAFESTFGKRLIPTKEEYRDAMCALLQGTFWTDSIWNGRRQQCFFPAYRLCRYLGYSHEQLWQTGGILDGVDRYYRSGEITYWRNRESSDIIQQIDADIDAMEVENA